MGWYMAIPCPRTSAITRSAAASRPCTPEFKKGQSGNPRGPRPKNLPALLIGAAFIYADNLSGRVSAILGYPTAQLAQIS